MLYFSDWLADVGEQKAFEHLPEAELDSLLCQFYAGLAPAGESVDYSKSSYVNIRAGLNRYLRSPPTQRKINLMHDKEFMESNQVFSGLLKTMRRAGLDKTTHKTPISAGDMDRLYASGVLSNDMPWGLIYKVYFKLSLHFTRRGVEGIQEPNSQWANLVNHVYKSVGGQFIFRCNMRREDIQALHIKSEFWNDVFVKLVYI